MTKEKRDSTKKAEGVTAASHNGTNGHDVKANKGLKKAEIAALIESINSVDLPPLPPYQV